MSSHEAWKSSLPKDFAGLQQRYDRGAFINRGRRAGLTYREIGERLGISLERVRVLNSWFERKLRNHTLSPAERFCTPVLHMDLVQSLKRQLDYDPQDL